MSKIKTLDKNVLEMEGIEDDYQINLEAINDTNKVIVDEEEVVTEDVDIDFYAVFIEQDLFEDCEELIVEEIYSEKDYFIPTSANMSMEDKNKLAIANMNIIPYVVNRFLGTGIDYDELESVALIGYTKAINNFDPEKRTKAGKTIKFVTFAYKCIENELSGFVRIDKKYTNNTISIETPLATDNSGNILELGETISNEDSGKPSVEEITVRSSIVEILLKVIEEHLTDREKTIIRHRFGLSTDNKTQTEVGEMVNMSQANISKLEKGTMEKIKTIMVNKYKIDNFDF